MDHYRVNQFSFDIRATRRRTRMLGATLALVVLAASAIQIFGM